MQLIVLKNDVFKLLNNSTFDKTIENLRKRINVRLANRAEYYKKWISRLSYVLQKIFDKNCVASHKIKPVLTFVKPIYIGFSNSWFKQIINVWISLETH